MTRRIVVLPLPEAPSNTNASPSATSKEISSSTEVLPKRLLMPRTLAAACVGAEFEREPEFIFSGTMLIALAAITVMSDKLYVDGLFPSLQAERG